MRRGWIWVLVTLAVVGLLVVVALALLSNRAVTTSVARDLIARYQSQIPARIAFEHMSVDALHGRVALDGLKLTVPNRPDQKFVQAKQVIADLDMGALLKRQVHIRKLHLVDPDVTIVHYGGDRYNFSEILPQQETPEKPNQQASMMTLSALTVDGGHLTYEDTPRKLDAELPHLKAALSLDLPGHRVAGSTSLADGWVRYDGRKQAIDSFLADFRLAGKDLTLNKLKLNAGETDVALRGTIGGLGDADQPLGLEGLAKTRLQQWSPFVHQPIAGLAQADFQVHGSVKAPQVAGRVSGQELGYKALRVDSLSARVTSGAGVVKVDDLLAHLWGGRIAGSATVPVRKGERLAADVRADELDLAAAARQLELKGTQGLTGKASLAVRAGGDRLAPEAIVANGWVRADGQVPVNGRDLPLQARTDFRWDAGQLALTRVEATALGGHLQGEGRVTPLAKEPAYAVTAHVDTLEVDRVAHLIGKPLPVSGRVGGDVTLAGRDFRHPELKGNARVTADGTLAEKVAGNKRPLPFTGNANVDFSGKTLQIASANARVLGGDVAAHGTIGLAGPRPRMALVVDARGVDLAAVDRTFAVAQGRLAGRADGHVSLNDQVLDIQRVDARALGGHVAASGRVLLADKPPAYALHVDAKGVDLGVLTRTFRLARVPVTGKGDARLAVSGAGPRFHAAGPIALAGVARVPDQMANGTTQPLPFKLAGQIEAGPRALKLQPLEAKVGNSRLVARGALNLDGASNLAVTGRVVDTPAIAAVFGVKDLAGGAATIDLHATGSPGHVQIAGHVTADRTRLDGQVRFASADLRVAGTLASRLHLAGTLAGRDLVVAGQPLTTVTTPIAYDAQATKLGGGTLALGNVDARLAHGRLTGKASYDLAKRAYVANFATQGLTMGDLVALKAHGTPGLPATTRIAAAYSGRGTLARPQGDLHLTLQNFAYNGQAFGPSDLKGQLVGGALVLNGGLFGKELTVDGRLPFAASASGKLVVHFNDIRLAPLLAMAPPGVSEQVELPIDGRLAGAVTLTGTLARPDRLVADVDLSRLRVAYRDLMLDNDGPIRLRYAGRYVNVEAFHLRGQGTDLTADGTVGVGGPSDFRARGSVNLALLEKLSPKNFADATGSAGVNATLRGTFGQPDLVGSLNVRNADLTTRNLPQAIRGLNASLRLDHDRLFLDRLKATLGYTGQVEAVGGATLGQNMLPREVNLQVTGRELALRVPETNALVNADLAFSGTPDDSRLNGQIKVLEAKYTQDVSLTGAILGRKRGRGGMDLSKIPFLRNLDMHVQVNAPGQVVVKNNLADMELRGDLMVLGTPASPSVVGRAETLQGAKITFQDRTYDVTEATVDFINPDKIEPYLHLVATTAVQGIDVSLTANGTPQAMKLDLKSTPYMPQADVLTLLATGQTPAQLAQGTGGGGGAALSNLLLNQVAKGVERGVSDQGAIDVLRIQPGSTGADQSSGGSVTVGKRINDKLMITYTQDLTSAPGKPQGRQVIFDYTLTDNMVLKLQQDLSGGGFNASARYRYPVR